MSDTPLLDVRGLTTHYISARGTRVTRAVEDVSFTLRDGETLGIVGESGSGKTTLALSLLRLLPPAARIVAGAVRFEGDDLLRKPAAEMRRPRGKRIAMILQDPIASLNPPFTIGYQAAQPLAMIFITHNLGIVAKMCDRVAVMYAGRMVEGGPIRKIFNAPAHPYTKALLESIPRLGDGRARLTAIDGQPPDPANPPAGCAFHPRCPRVMDHCRQEAPPELVVGESQTARCWLAADRR